LGGAAGSGLAERGAERDLARARGVAGGDRTALAGALAAAPAAWRDFTQRTLNLPPR